MPIYQINEISATLKVGVWKITETADVLLNQLMLLGFKPADVPSTKNNQHLQQWAAIRLLLFNFLKTTAIVYDDLGKPHLENGWNISISHANEFAAIMLNKNGACGIDIEKISPKIARIKHKFLNDTDLKNITTEQNLTIYWGAKEALYKYYGKKKVFFIEHLFIQNFNKNHHYFDGLIKMPHFTKKIPMAWEKIEDYMLVYTQ